MHTPARRKLTYDDFVLFPDDGQRHELIDGAHYVTPSPNTSHQRVLRRLMTDLLVILHAQAKDILTDQPELAVDVRVLFAPPAR